MPRRILLSLLVSLALLVPGSVSLYGQSTYGTVSGSVTDTSGATVTDANVTLTNSGTSEKRTQSSGSDGLFTFVNLFPGQYRVDVEKAGFKHFVRTGIAVDVQQNARIDVALQVGEVSQTVEVTSEVPLLQSETSSLGTVVDTREANELPLNGRNIFNLTTITPSVVPQGNTTGTVVGKNPFDFANYQIGGAFANEAAEYLDGQPLNIGYINLPLEVPTQDSIGEFKVQYNNLGPEWGKFAGGVINLSTKSGTNTWHGSAYEYLRNKVFNSNEFFNKKQELSNGGSNSPPPFTQNQYGVTIGGAVIKNKTFVFGSWEAFRLRSGTVFSTNVPTMAERGGDFSASAATIYDPLSVDPTCPVSPTTPCTRTAFAGNVIPTAQLNSTALYLLKYLPLPNSTSATDNFVKATSTGGNIDEYVARVDQTLNSKSTLFGRFTFWKLLSLAQDPFGTGLCKDRCAENSKSKSLALGYNRILGANTTFNINLSISRFQYIRNPINSGFDMMLEGWPAAYNGPVPSSERTPLTPCFAKSDPTVTCSQGQSAIADHNTQFNISPQVTMIKGRHTFAFGGQLEEGYDNYLQTNTGGGLISFNGSWTQSFARNFCNTTSGPCATGGIDFADFLLGYGLGAGAAFGNQTTGSLVISGPVSGKQTYRGFYFGDTWHATSKLTLNLGVRYELQGPWSERYDKMTYFNPTAANSSVTGCGGVAGSSCPGDLFLVKTGVNGSRNNLPLSKKEILPRLGFAYALNSKTVIRGGYGIFFIPNYVSFGTNPYVDPVSSATSPFYASNDGGLTPSATLNQNTCTLSAANAPLTCSGLGPFNQGGASSLVAVPGRNPQPNVSQYILTQNNFSATGYTVQKYGYLEQYNFDIQRELPGGFFADIAYAGSHGVHLEQFNTNINQIPDSFIAQAAQQAAAGQPVTIAQPVAAYPFSQNLPGALGPTNLVQGQLDRPFPQYSGLNLNGFGCCSSNYNALQATVTRRFQGGGTMLVAYTNAKLMSNTDTLTSWLEGGTSGGVGGIQDWNNLKGERSLSSQDVSQRMVISYVLDLPFGRGKRYLSDVHGIAGGAVSGWGLDGVTTLQRGFPVKISDGNGNSLTALSLGTGGLRPNVVAGCHKSTSGSAVSRVGEWFNTSCFTDPPAWGFGDEPRVDATLRQQGVVNFDFAVFKKTSITERFNVEFRTEFFNLFNHPQFGPPNGTFGSSNFGVVTNTVNLPRLIQFGLKFNF